MQPRAIRTYQFAANYQDKYAQHAQHASQKQMLGSVGGLIAKAKLDWNQLRYQQQPPHACAWNSHYLPDTLPATLSPK
jgi:hypothetical protein